MIAPSNSNSSSRLSRRNALSLLTATLISCELGCQSTNDAETESDSKPKTSSVPLRLLIVDEQVDTEAVSRSWNAVSSQPLKADMLSLDEVSRSEQPNAVIDAVLKHDVVWLPRVFLPDLVDAQSVIQLAEASFGESLSSLYPSLLHGTANYAGLPYCLPISSAFPVILSGEEIPAISDWRKYDHVVKQNWNGAACEPSAEGDLAEMFLLRAAGNVRRWLFEPNSFEPVITDPDWAETLDLMRSTFSKYGEIGLSASQIHDRVASGDLKGGIGTPSKTFAESINSSPMPFPENAPAILPAIDRQVVCLSANCRQTSASEVLMKWISGGDGSEQLRRQLASTFPIVDSSMTSQSSGGMPSTANAVASSAGYAAMTRALLNPVVLPDLAIHQSSLYYDALERQLAQCLKQDISPAEALQAVHKEWARLTADIGREKQARAWKLAKGFTAN